MKLKRKESDLKQTVAEAQGAQTRLKYSKTDLENLQKKTIPRCQAVGPQNSDLNMTSRFRPLTVPCCMCTVNSAKAFHVSHSFKLQGTIDRDADKPFHETLG